MPHLCRTARKRLAASALFKPRNRGAAAFALLAVVCYGMLAGCTQTAWWINPGPSSRVQYALAHVSPAVVRIDVVMRSFENGTPETFRAIGSGVIIDRKGHVLTNFHVAGRARHIEVTLADKEHVHAVRVGADHWTDLALLQMNMQEIARKHIKFRWAKLGNSRHVQLGEPVLAIGTPYGLSRTVTRGIISNTDRYFSATTIDGYETGWFNNWIQTDAAINPGNSGGPLINLRGEVIGINTRGDPDANNLGFAIPINVARRVIPQLLKQRRVVRSYIGLHLQPLRGLAKFYKIAENHGVLVSSVDPDSPASKVGLEPQDILLSVNGRPTNCRFPEELASIRRYIADQPVNSTLTLVIDRPGSTGQPYRVLAIKTNRLESAVAPEHAIVELGISVRRLTDPYLRARRLPLMRGVLVTGVRSGSPADTAGLEAGDIILQLNAQPVHNVHTLQTLVTKLAKTKGEAAVIVRRGRSEKTLVINLGNNS